jgi:hypothetical protein
VLPPPPPPPHSALTLTDIAVSNALSDLSELSDEEKAEQTPIKDATTRASFWTQQIINVPISHGYAVLRDHVLPVPNLYLTLFFCAGCLIGIDPSSMKDPCGDITWDAIKKVSRAPLSLSLSLSLTPPPS